MYALHERRGEFKEQLLREVGRQKNKNEQAGSYLDLFGDARWRKHALLGMALAAVGLASFWAVGVAVFLFEHFTGLFFEVADI